MAGVDRGGVWCDRDHPSVDTVVEETTCDLPANGLLAPAIAAFRERFHPQHHTDEKIVDWLIWALVGLADEGALLDGRIVYS